MVINSNVRSWFGVVCSILETVFLLPRCHILQFLYIFGCIYGSVLIFVLDRRRVRLAVKVRTITATCVSLGECQKYISSHSGPNARKVFADDKTDSEMQLILARAC